jgi:hypothetical protein
MPSQGSTWANRQIPSATRCCFDVSLGIANFWSDVAAKEFQCCCSEFSKKHRVG